MAQLLKEEKEFAGYMVCEKVSNHHDGEREVYLAINSETGEKVALTVFNLGSKRYECAAPARGSVPDFIEEIKFLKNCSNDCGLFARFIDCGISGRKPKRMAWMAQEWVSYHCLSDELEWEMAYSNRDLQQIMKALIEGIAEIRGYTHGGGHYGISCDNILLEHDVEGLQGIRLIGFTNIGKQYKGSTPFEAKDVDKRFMPPETASGVYNHFTDIYSLGMVMGCMIGGDWDYFENFGGDNIDYDDQRISEQKKRNEGDFDISKFRSGFVKGIMGKRKPDSLTLIFQKATNPIPGNRFQRIEKFRQFLDRIGDERSSSQPDLESDGDGNEVAAKFLRKEGDSVKESNILKKRKKSDSKQGNCPAKNHGLDEVAGMADLKAILRRNFVDIVKNSKMAGQYGITPPNGILLYGAPGCGKTFVAEKIAQESGLKYEIFNPSDFGSIYIHGSQGKIAQTFKEAEENGPMILIFDEFDAIAPKRDADNGAQANEVNEMLTQLNNCSARGIYVLATSNRPDMIDAACLRTGRLDEKFYVGLPDMDARKEIFAMELKDRPCDSNIDFELLGKATTDFTCSDISYIVKETARRCFDEAIRNKEGKTIPLTTEKLMEVTKNINSSVGPKDIRQYLNLKDKMEYRDRENRAIGKVGFNTGN